MEKENNCNCELEKYKITLDFLKFEATTLWQIFSAFMVGHVILIGFISTALLKNGIADINFILLLITGLIGLSLSFLWFGTFHGNSNWYYYRMEKQAKKAEELFVNHIGDKNWFLLNKDAEKHSRNNSFISNRSAGYCMISIFIIIYISVICLALCKLNCNC
ncbi:MAG: hypothetical protein HXX09_14195 [Bacteroidetes bacterium]|nr:hypothetical protein [Bacteroidota bacterium]